MSTEFLSCIHACVFECIVKHHRQQHPLFLLSPSTHVRRFLFLLCRCRFPALYNFFLLRLLCRNCRISGLLQASFPAPWQEQRWQRLLQSNPMLPCIPLSLSSLKCMPRCLQPLWLIRNGKSMWSSPMACGGRCRMSSLIPLCMHGPTEQSLLHTSGTGEIPARGLIDQMALLLPSIDT